MTLHWLLRAKRWVQNPPSARRVRLVLAVIVLCLGLAAVEALGLWPDALSVNSGPTGRIGR